MSNTQNILNIVILDACRNNPFARGFRSIPRGLAAVNAPNGTLIEYATAQGDIANDGDARNSPFTEELLKYIRQPGLEITDVFRRVRAAVRAKTNGKQIPWESSSIETAFYFLESQSKQPLEEQSKPPQVAGNSYPNLQREIINLSGSWDFKVFIKDGTITGDKRYDTEYLTGILTFNHSRTNISGYLEPSAFNRIFSREPYKRVNISHLDVENNGIVFIIPIVPKWYVFSPKEASSYIFTGIITGNEMVGTCRKEGTLPSPNTVGVNWSASRR
jgi:hypothetical protein